MFQAAVNTVAVERKEVEKQASVEEQVTKKEALDRYIEFISFWPLMADVS